MKQNAKDFYASMVKQIRRFKEIQDRATNAPELICRICEQTMSLDKFIV